MVSRSAMNRGSHGPLCWRAGPFAASVFAGWESVGAATEGSATFTLAFELAIVEVARHAGASSVDIVTGTTGKRDAPASEALMVASHSCARLALGTASASRGGGGIATVVFAATPIGGTGASLRKSGRQNAPAIAGVRNETSAAKASACRVAGRTRFDEQNIAATSAIGVAAIPPTQIASIQIASIAPNWKLVRSLTLGKLRQMVERNSVASTVLLRFGPIWPGSVRFGEVHDDRARSTVVEFLEQRLHSRLRYARTRDLGAVDVGLVIAVGAGDALLLKSCEKREDCRVRDPTAALVKMLHHLADGLRTEVP